MDVATLKVVVDSTDAKKATAEIGKMGVQGEQTEQQLRSSLGRTIAKIREMQDAWKGARIGDTEFVDGVKRLQIQADQTRSALSRMVGAQDAAAAATKGVGGAAADGAVHLGRLRETMTALAAQATATNPALARISSVILSLGIGSVATVAVLAGIAAIGAAMRAAQADAEAFNKALDDQHKAVMENAKSYADAADRRLEASRRGLELRRAEIQTEIVYLNAITLTNKSRVNDLIELNKALIEINARIAELDAPTKAHTDRVHEQRVAVDTLEQALARLNKTFETWLANQKRGQQLFTISSVLGTTKSAPNVPTIDLAEANRVAAELGRATIDLVAPTAKVNESWQNVAASVANVVTLLANADDASLRFLGTLVTAVGQVESAVAEVDKMGKLSATTVAGLVATGVSLIASIFGGGESPAQRRSREIQEQNTEAIRKLTDVFTLQITGNSRAVGTAATSALLGPAGNGIGLFAGAGGGLDINKVRAILAANGTDLQAFKDFAKAAGITLDITNATTFINSLKALDEQLKKSELAHFADTFGGQMKLLNAQLAGENITDPLEKLRRTVAVLTGSQGASAFGGALGGLNLGSQVDRNAAINRLLGVLGEIQRGTFDTTQTGGLTLQEFLDQLVGTIDLLRQVDETSKQRDDSLQATIDTLRKFSDSLKLSDLTTLSPVQQLAEARRQYDAVLAQAQGGDQAAAAQLPEVARQLLTASRAVNASGPAFAADFQAVLAQTEAVAKLFEGQKSQQDQIIAYTGEMAYNTAALVESSKDQVAVLKEGFTTLQQQQEEMNAAIEQLIKETRAGNEGGRL